MATITVHVSFSKVNGTTLAAPVNAPGVYCFTNPDFTTNSADVVAEATTDASGNASFSVPGGWYIFQCRPAKPGSAAAVDYADDMKLTDKVSVAAGGAKTVEVQANRTNPLYFTTAPSVAKTSVLGTGTVNTGAVSVSGATFTVTPVAAKSVVDVTLDSNNSFTLPDVDGILAKLDSGTTDVPNTLGGRGLWKAFKLPLNPGFVGLGDGVARSLAKGLTFKVTATAGTNTASVNVTGAIGGLQDIQGGSNTVTGTAGVTHGVGPIGVLVIASDKAAASYNWTISGVDKNNAAVGGLSLNGATTRNPYFTPTVEGIYTLTNSAPTTPTVLTFTAASYVGLLAADGSASACGACHNNAAPGAPGWYTMTYMGYASTQDYFFHEMGVHGNHNFFSDPDSRKTQAAGAETIFQWGLQGVDYAPTCYRCHTTGSFWVNSNGPESTVSNNGFQDRMNALDATAKVTDPTAAPMRNAWAGDGVDHYSSLDGSLKAMGGIQCESCHGPGSMHMALGGADATTGDVKGLVTPWGVEACAVCHDAPGHHDKVELWSKSLHNNAIAVRGETTGTAANSCERCHTAQGFAAMVKNITRAGTAHYTWTTMPAGASALPVLKPGTAQPQTCQACHEAHSTELRLEDTVRVAPNGQSYSGVGAGAVCIACHVALAANPDSGSALVTSGSVGTPHHGPQADILFGTSAYFVTGTYVGKHAAVKDTCVGCHVKLVPDSVATGNDNHTFSADKSICKSCHGASVNGEAVQAAIAGRMKTLGAKLAASIQAQLTTLAGGAGYTIVTASDSAPQTVYLTTAPTSVALGAASFHGSPSWDVTVNGTVYNAVQASIYSGNGKTTKAMGQAGNWAKALWNYLLIEEDKSEGIHNPTFVNAVIDASLAQDLSN